MKSSPVFVFLLGVVLFGLAGCQLPPESVSRPPRVYLMLVVPEGMQPQDLPARREQIVRYLLESDLLRSREDLVSDPELADQTIRATLLEDGFKLEFLNPATGRVIGYAPTWMPDDYYFYEGLIFYGAVGSSHPRHPRDDDDRRHSPPAPPPHAPPPGHRDDDDHRPPPSGTPGHPPRPPGHDRPDDHPRSEPPKTGTPSPRTPPPTPQPHSPLPPGPSANRPKYNDDRPTRDDRPAPREHPRGDDGRKHDDDRQKQDPPRPATIDPKPDSAVVPPR